MDELLREPWARWLVAFGAALLGLAAAAAAAALVGRTLARTRDPHVVSLGRKLVFYAGLFFVVVTVLRILAFELTHILAAAGLAGVALGFAAQTSVSNVISGLFLIFEGAFKVGDVVRVGDVTGTVLSIDLLSVKVRTLDHLFVRIPNETLIKSNLTNLTRFDVRRVDLKVSVAYRESIPRAVEVLQRVLDEHPLVLKKPDPIVFVESLADSGVVLVARCWIERAELVRDQSTILAALKGALDAEGIEIPFPHVKLVADEAILETLGRRADS